MPSTVEQLKEGDIVFVARTKSECKTIKAYYGLLLYSDLFKQLPLMKQYVKGTMPVPIGTFIQCSMVLPKPASDCCGNPDSCWKVAAQLCAIDGLNYHMPYI